MKIDNDLTEIPLMVTASSVPMGKRKCQIFQAASETRVEEPESVWKYMLMAEPGPILKRRKEAKKAPSERTRPLKNSSFVSCFNQRIRYNGPNQRVVCLVSTPRVKTRTEKKRMGE